MKKLVRYEINDVSHITMEVDEPSSDTNLATMPGKTLEMAKDKFEDVLKQIKPATTAVLATLKDLADSPDEATVEFGVKLNTSSGVVIASASVEANFVFKLTWKRKLDAATT